MSKKCCKCKAEKPLEAFHRNKNYPDGRAIRCAECTNAGVKAARAKDPEKEKERQRRWQEENREHCREYSKRYRAENPEVHRQSAAKQRAKRPAGRGGIYTAVWKAVKRGELVRPNECEECGEDGYLHGHHDDYSKPLEVRWLCPLCHSAVHKEEAPAWK